MSNVPDGVTQLDGAQAHSTPSDAARPGESDGAANPRDVAPGAAGTSSNVPGAQTRVDDPLGVDVRDVTQLKISVVTLACAGDCADIEAVASGGTPPYLFSWEDGSTDPKRRVCLEASKTLRITVKDTAIDPVDFGSASAIAIAEVIATVSTCPDAGAPPPSGCTREPQASCKLSSGASLPEDMTVKLIDEQQYFAGGADLPAGRYRLTYLDGCFSYGDPAVHGWTVNFMELVGLGCNVIGPDGVPLLAAPGTEGTTLAAGARETYAECVAANCDEAPLDFDHVGGRLGLARNGGTAFAEFDDSDGTDVGGRGPTYRLSRLDPCP